MDHKICIAFSPTEYKLLVCLLSGELREDDELAQEAAGCSLEQWKKANLKRYIDKIRYKVRSAGLNVHRISGYGYVLRASEVATPPQ